MKNFYENNNKVKQRFATRKLKKGVVSLLIGVTVFGTGVPVANMLTVTPVSAATISSSTVRTNAVKQLDTYRNWRDVETPQTYRDCQDVFEGVRKPIAKAKTTEELDAIIEKAHKDIDEILANEPQEIENYKNFVTTEIRGTKVDEFEEVDGAKKVVDLALSKLEVAKSYIDIQEAYDRFGSDLSKLTKVEKNLDYAKYTDIQILNQIKYDEYTNPEEVLKLLKLGREEIEKAKTIEDVRAVSKSVQERLKDYRTQEQIDEVTLETNKNSIISKMNRQFRKARRVSANKETTENLKAGTRKAVLTILNSNDFVEMNKVRNDYVVKVRTWDGKTPLFTEDETAPDKFEINGEDYKFKVERADIKKSLPYELFKDMFSQYNSVLSVYYTYGTVPKNVGTGNIEVSFLSDYFSSFDVEIPFEIVEKEELPTAMVVKEVVPTPIEMDNDIYIPHDTFNDTNRQLDTMKYAMKNLADVESNEAFKQIKVDVKDTKKNDDGTVDYTVLVTALFGDKEDKVSEKNVVVHELAEHKATADTLKVQVDEEITEDMLKSQLNDKEYIKSIKVEKGVDTKTAGDKEITLQVTYLDNVVLEVVVPVNVKAKPIPWTPINPIPQITVDGIKLPIIYVDDKDSLDTFVKEVEEQVKEDNKGVDIKDIKVDEIDTSKENDGKVKVRVTFGDGSSRVVELNYEVKAKEVTPEVPDVTPVDPTPTKPDVKPDIPWTPINPIPEIDLVGIELPPLTVGDSESVNQYIESLTSQIRSMNGDKGIKDIEVGEVDVTTEATRTLKVKVVFEDGSARVLNIDYKVKAKEVTPDPTPIEPDVIPWTPINPIPQIEEKDITKEVVMVGDIVDLTDNVNVPDGATVEVLDEVDTTTAHDGTARVKVTFGDGSSVIVNVPYSVKEKDIPETPDVDPTPDVTPDNPTNPDVDPTPVNPDVTPTNPGTTPTVTPTGPAVVEDTDGTVDGNNVVSEQTEANTDNKTEEVKDKKQTETKTGDTTNTIPYMLGGMGAVGMALALKRRKQTDK